MENELKFALGRLDIVDLYEWKTSNKLIFQTYFQRQSVWRDKDRIELIDTIMRGYPIPAIFICDASTDYSSSKKIYNVLDGRQRLESIFMFLEGEFSYNGKRYLELDDEQKKKILNYNIALVQMYINPSDVRTIKEIFSRLNKGAYNLNKIEKQSSQLVEYDYMIISKIAIGQIRYQNIESYIQDINELFPQDDEDQEIELTDYEDANALISSVNTDIKTICDMNNIDSILEIYSKSMIFTDYEINRQVNLQYFLNIFTSIYQGTMVHRNVSENAIISLSDEDKERLEEKLKTYNSACKSLLNIYQLGLNPFWMNKASFFTLSVLYSLCKNEISYIDNDTIVDKLNAFYASDSELWKEYSQLSQQGVNDLSARNRRHEILSKILLANTGTT